MQITTPRAALFASPGMGHVIPVIELGKRLAADHGFHVTVFVLEADAASAQSQFLSSPGCDETLVNVIGLPSPDISGLVDPTSHIVIKIAAMMRETVPAVRSKIAAMKPKPTALIVDLFGTEALRLAEEFGLLKYVLIASNARFLAVAIYFPTVDKTAEEDHIDQKQPLAVPGCEPVRFEDTLDAYLDRTDSLYPEVIRLGLAFPTADGILVNSWEEMEPNSLKSLRDPKLLGQIARAPVHPIGPLIRPVEPSKSGHPVLDWLDKQPNESVLYISFGSGGSLSAKQLTELAWGLELSQQRFVWVVRPPVDGSAFSAFFAVNSSGVRDGTPEYLPQGFVTRTGDRGLVVPAWAPQTEVLAHRAVGGFLTHCGWNSILESVVSGVPMIAWPLFAEQKMNAALLTDEIGIAVRCKKLPSDGVISRTEIEGMVRKIMVEEEGDLMRNKVKQLRNTAERALSHDGGSAYGSLSKVAKECVFSLERVSDKARGA